MPSFETVVVATDFSEFSDRAVAYAKSIAGKFGAALHVIHVAEDMSAAYAVVEGPLPDIAGMQDTADRDARQRLDRLVTAEDRWALAAQTFVLPSSPVAAAIVDYTHRQASPVIVMGTHGRTGIARLLLGSVAERVIRLADCPVLTVRTPADPMEDAVSSEERELAGVA